MPNIMLTELYIDNFKSFHKSKFKFGKVNCLVAPNNAGKSNLIEVFEFINTMLLENIAQAVGNVGISIIRNYKYDENEITIKPKFNIDNIVLVDNYIYKYSVIVDFNFIFKYKEGPYPIEINVDGKIKKIKIDKDDISPNSLNRVYNNDIKSYDKYIELLSKKRYMSVENDLKLKDSSFKKITTNSSDINIIIKNIFGVENIFLSFYFHPNEIKNNQKYEEKFLLKDATNLAYYLKTLDTDVFDDISMSLIGEVDLVESIELLDGAFPIIIFKENTDGLINEISQHRVSDGTIHFLSIMTALKTSKSNCLIFEEPERHMHMKTLSYILNTMRDSNKQIFFTTHSTEILQQLKLDEIIFMFRNHSGDTKGIRAKEIKNIKKIMKLYKNDLVEMLKIGILDNLEDEL